MGHGSHVKGAVRPGCLHMTVDARLTRSTAAAAEANGPAAFARALACGPNAAFWLQQLLQV